MDKLHLPIAFPDDTASSDSQREAVQTFYTSVSLGDITGGQAGDLLDYRDFARAVVRRLAPNLYGEPARSAAERIAVYVSRHRQIAIGVIAFMRKRFERGADPDNLHRAIGRLDFFEDLELEFEDELG